MMSLSNELDDRFSGHLWTSSGHLLLCDISSMRHWLSMDLTLNGPYVDVDYDSI